MRFLVLDFETRSPLDIKKVGAYEYAEQASILCAAWKLDDAPVRVWNAKLFPASPRKAELLELLANPDTMVAAHNAEFERLIIRKCLVRDLPLERFICTAAMSAAHALPRDLAGACDALKLDHRKNPDGKKLIRAHCMPQKLTPLSGEWNDDPAGLKRLAAYCADDVRATAELFRALPRLTPEESEVWRMNQEINTRGMAVDRKLISSALKMIAHETETLNAEFVSLTGGHVATPTQGKVLLAYLAGHCECALPNLQKKTVIDALETGVAKGRAKRLLEIRQSVSKTSTAKYVAFSARTNHDGILRGTQLYHGASTGRESGRGVQVQNFPRGSLADVGGAIGDIRSGDSAWVRAVHGDVMAALSGCLRGVIKARPGHEFFCGDFSQIEVRVLFWLAGYDAGLKVFRDGGDLYREMASAIYRVELPDVTAAQREVGKRAVLGCGYSMGFVKFGETCALFGTPVSTELAKLAVDTYRKKYAAVTLLWSNLGRAAIEAVRNPGKRYTINRVTWFVENKFLYGKLPSGRRLAYCDPEIRVRPTPWGEPRAALHFYAPNSTTGKWERQHTYPGALAENVTQAVARDFMVSSQLRTRAAGYIPVMSVHDECLAESLTGRATLAEFESLMSVTPTWAKDFPLAVKGWQGPRYRK